MSIHCVGPFNYAVWKRDVRAEPVPSGICMQTVANLLHRGDDSVLGP
jgi:hypothetical protein